MAVTLLFLPAQPLTAETEGAHGSAGAKGQHEHLLRKKKTYHCPTRFCVVLFAILNAISLASIMSFVGEHSAKMRIEKMHGHTPGRISEVRHKLRFERRSAHGGYVGMRCFHTHAARRGM